MSVLTIFSLDVAIKILFRIAESKIRGHQVKFEKNLLFETGQSDVIVDEIEQIIKE